MGRSCPVAAKQSIYKELLRPNHGLRAPLDRGAASTSPCIAWVDMFVATAAAAAASLSERLACDAALRLHDCWLETCSRHMHSGDGAETALAAEAYAVLLNEAHMVNSSALRLAHRVGVAVGRALGGTTRTQDEPEHRRIFGHLWLGDTQAATDTIARHACAFYAESIARTMSSFMASTSTPACMGADPEEEVCATEAGGTGRSAAECVYLDGVFDLFHLGHMRLLRRARALGRKLVVGVVTDAETAKWKRQPVVPFELRLRTVEASGLADLVVKAEPIDARFLDSLGIDLVVHGDDSEQAEYYRVPLQRGIMRYLSYTPDLSTTQLLRWADERHLPFNERSRIPKLVS